jgi:hypothetical protein
MIADKLTSKEEARIANVFKAHAERDSGRLVAEIQSNPGVSGSVVRHQAVWALGQLGARDANPALAELLRNDPSPDGSQAAGSLIEALSDESPMVRDHVAAMLGEVGDAAAVGPLTMRLGDESSNVRDSAARSLGQLDDPVALEALTDLRRGLGWRESKHVRRAIRRLSRS